MDLSSSESGVLFSSLMGFGLVDGQIGFREVELQQVRAAGERQWADRLSSRASSRLQQMSDVLAGEGIEGECVLEGTRGGVLAVGLQQGEDRAQVRAGVEAAGGESIVVGGRPVG